MGVVAVFAEVVASPAVMAVFAGWAIPDHVSGLELLTEAAAVREGCRFGGAAGLGIVVVVLGHGVPPYVAFACVSNRCGQSNAPSAHGFRSIMIRDECGMIKIRMNTRVDSRMDEATPGFSIPNPPMSAFVGQFMLTSGEVHILPG